MIDPHYSIPLHQTLNMVTMVQALAFSAWFCLRPWRASLSARLLALFFLMLFFTKADELFQMLGGVPRYPQYAFVLSPLQALLTPLLYLFVVSRTAREFRLRRHYSIHLTPALLLFVYLWAVYFRFDTSAKAALIDAGGLETIANYLVVPLLGDAIQLGYIVAALALLHRHGVSLRGWFATIENKTLAWMRQILTLWAAVFVLHAMLTAAQGTAILQGAQGAGGAGAVIILVLNLAHLAIANLLALQGSATMENPSMAAPETKDPAPERDDAVRRALFQRIEEALEADQLYLSTELTLGDLANHVAATAREASEAINGAGGQTFFELINRARVTHAKRALIDQPGARIIDIAYAAGFNSKSAFHDAFRKYAGMTPGAWRRQAAPAG